MSIGLHRAKSALAESPRNDDWATIPAASVFDWTAELVAAERACCCSAKPIVAVVLPTLDLDSDPVALLLCGHHYRAGRSRLEAKRASAYDRHGRLIIHDPWPVA